MENLINQLFEIINSVVAKFFFFDVLFLSDSIDVPLIVLVLFLSSVYFTLKMGFVNVRFFRRAIQLVLGKEPSSKNSSEKTGEITHFRALTTALSATVGLGNIAGVALAISIGGPGATFWMIVMGLLGMSTKFTECTLGVMYRETRSDGHLMGGPMEYLKKGLDELNWKKLGTFLSIVFCIMCIGGSFGGGTAFQVNQSLTAIAWIMPFFKNYQWVYGLLLAGLVGVVIMGGLKRISSAASRIVPSMCTVYVLMVSYVLIVNYQHIPDALLSILKGAFVPEAAFGGFFGVMMAGLRRAAFSNEAGLGSAAIAHSAAKVKYPVEEGIVALLEPFIDTVLICTMTALLIIITGVYENPAYMELVNSKQGAALTSSALSEVVVWFPYVLCCAVFLFAFSTIISWSYYGERCFSYLFGDTHSYIYKWLLLVVIFISSLASAVNIMEFGDLMILGMAFPNLAGVILLSGKVKKALKDYQQKG